MMSFILNPHILLRKEKGGGGGGGSNQKTTEELHHTGHMFTVIVRNVRWMAKRGPSLRQKA